MMPLVGSSKPAIILRAVDFPHPEGPTRMANSLSSTVRLKFLTASTLPKFFETFSRTTLAIYSILLFCPAVLYHSEEETCKHLFCGWRLRPQPHNSKNSTKGVYYSRKFTSRRV